MNKLDKNALEKAKTILGELNDLPIEDIYDKLYVYRNSQHPDKYQNEEAKKLAEEKFKEAGSLLELLKKEIELQLVNKNPSEIIPFQKTYDNIQLKQTNVEFQDEIRNLKTKIELLNYENKNLKKELKALRNEKLSEKKDELKEHYKPSRKNIFSNGIIFILTLLTTIFSKVEEIALVIGKYSPIPQSVINYFLFGILIFIPLRFLFQYLKQNAIDKITQLIFTPPIIQLFLSELSKEKKAESFTESNVYEFILRIRYPKNKILRWILNNLFGLQSHNVMNSLKDIFIYNLLSKQLIEISRADNLDRNFRIIKEYYRFSLNDDDDIDINNLF